MKAARSVLGVLCILTGALLTAMLWSASRGGGWVQGAIVLWCLAAAAGSVCIFRVCHLAGCGKVAVNGFGVLLSYAAIFSVLLLGSLCFGGFVEGLMWSPVMILFGLVNFAPLVGMAMLGSGLCFSSGKLS